jgi:hypothetical protein
VNSAISRVVVKGGTGNLLVNRTTQATSDTIYKLDVNGSARFTKRLFVDNGGAMIRCSNTQHFEVFDTFGTRSFMVGGGDPGIVISSTNIGASGRWVSMVRSDNSAFGGIRFYKDDNLDSLTGYFGFDNRNENGRRFRLSSSRTDIINDDALVATPTTLFLGYKGYDTVPSASLAVRSTTQGFLQPRMTNTQRDAISTPAQGLQVFSTTDSANYVYRGTGGGWQKIANEISGSATLDFPSTGHGNSADLTFTVTGASEGDVVALGIPNASIVANASFTAWVSATDTVKVRFNNYASSGSSDPALGTFKIKVFK